MKRRGKKAMANKQHSALRRHEWAVISGNAVMMNLTHAQAWKMSDEKYAAGENHATVVTNEVAGRMLLSRIK